MVPEQQGQVLTDSCFLILLGVTTWLGFQLFSDLLQKDLIRLDGISEPPHVWSGITHTFPGIGKEFMPSLNEGSFLLMPTSMPHSGVE